MDIAAIRHKSVNVFCTVGEKEARYGLLILPDVVLNETLVNLVKDFWIPGGEVPPGPKRVFHPLDDARLKRLLVTLLSSKRIFQFLNVLETKGRGIRVRNTFEVFHALDNELGDKL